MQYVASLANGLDPPALAQLEIGRIKGLMIQEGGDLQLRCGLPAWIRNS